MVQRRAVLALSMALASPAYSQVPQIILSAPPMVIGQAQASSLLTGTTVILRTTSELTTKNKRLKVGDRFNLEVAEAIGLNGVTVIPVGSLAVGEITEVRNKGGFGRSGFIAARLLYVRANNRQIRLAGRFDNKGSANGGAAGVATYATLVGGFLVTGTSALIRSGTQITGYLDEDMPVTFASGTQSSNPMVVAVPPSAGSTPPK